MNEDFDIVVMNFADSKIPVFKEVGNKDYILCGEQNDYPEYLTSLYNKSSNHGAIINSKANYISGGGFEKRTPLVGGFVPVVNQDETTTPARSVNTLGETMADVINKCTKDIEIYGGFRLFVTYDNAGRVCNILHEDFYKFRTGKAGGFFHKKSWSSTDWKSYREKPVFYEELSQNSKKGTFVFAYNEYRPGTDIYPLPGYIGSCNYIEIDIEISKFHLSNLHNGMMSSKMIQFFDGEPPEDKKRLVEDRFKKKFTGSENAGKFILVFGKDSSKAVNISDLSTSDLDKQFDILNKTSEQHILAGHQVVSPMLFGIKTDGQLGGNNELKTAYQIFINTYAKPKQANLEKIVNYFGGLMGAGNDYYIKQLDPIGLQIDASSVLTLLPRDYIYDTLGIPEKYRTGQALIPSSTVAPADLSKEAVNDNLKNLTGRQHQNMLRIIRQLAQNKITEATAKVLIKSGFGLSDAEVLEVLGLTAPQDFSAQNEDEVIQMFADCGTDKNGYHIIKSKKVHFSSDDDAAEDELSFFTMAFAAADISDEEILKLIENDKRLTPEVLAEALKTTPEAVTAKLAELTERGLLKTKTVTVGQDNIIEREATKEGQRLPKADVPEISIMYSYEGPQDRRNRPFCARLMKLSRLYTRYEIEQLSQRLGYSVFDRRGGFWTRKNTNDTTAYCRHSWKSNIVIKKREAK